MKNKANEYGVVYQTRRVRNEKGVANSVSRGVRPVLWRGGAGRLQKIFASPRVVDVYLRKGEREKKSTCLSR